MFTALTWLMPHETVAISARSVYTRQPCTMSLHAKVHANLAALFGVSVHVLAFVLVSSLCVAGVGNKTNFKEMPYNINFEKYIHSF